jgi:hypothetical protein
MATRYYSNVAPPTTLTAGVNAITTTITIASAAGLPVFQPYTLVIDPDTITMELVQVNSAAGTTLTVTRAIDGTSASSHSAGAVVRHDSSARDFAESRAHEEADSAVHGVVGDVVGTTDVQTLSSKTLTSPAINAPIVTGGTITNSTINTNQPLASGTQTITGNSNISGNVDIEGTLTTGSGPDFDGNAQIGGSLNVSDGTTLSTTSNITATLDVQKNVGQTSNLQEWSFGSVLASVNSFGEAQFARATSSGAGVFAVAAGWTLVSAIVYQTAGVNTINVTVQRSGANIVAGAGGDITDSLLGTINANWRPNAGFTAADFAIFAQNSIGSGGANLAVNTGTVTLRSWNSAATISTGNNINFTATYVS